MEYFVHFFSILLIAVCAFTISTTLITYYTNKNKLFLYFTLLVACILAEMITLNFISFSNFTIHHLSYSELNHISYPPIRIIIGTALLFFDWIIIQSVFQIKWKKIQCLIFIPYIILASILSIIPQTNTTVLYFYSLRQCYRFAFIFYFLFHYIRTKEKSSLNVYAFPMIIVFIMNWCILFEDTTNITHIDTILQTSPAMSEYNLCEIFLWLILAIYISIMSVNLLFKTIAGQNCSINTISTDIRFDDEKILSFMDKHGFTKREKEVFQCLVNYMSIDEICDKLCISNGTAKTHIHNIYLKLDITSKNQLFAKLENFNRKDAYGKTNL